MNEYFAVENIQHVLSRARLIPSITMWNRIEGRPRAEDFDRTLKAEIRDPLWMLTKQWQMGEFKGDDAGSPVFAKIHFETTRLNKYNAANHGVQAFEREIPLEAKVERKKIPFTAGDQMLSLDIRLLMGRHWLKLINRPGLAGLKQAFIEAYGIYDDQLPDPDLRADALVCAHKNTWQKFAAVAGRCMDGGKLYAYLKADQENNHAYDGFASPPTNTQQILIDTLAEKFVTWFERLFYQPDGDDNEAWLPSKLEYQFACSAPKNGAEKVFTAEEYYHGHLDWYNLSVDAATETLGEIQDPDTDLETAEILTFIPVPLQFDGMPNTRWWTFEEGKTNFGDINPDTTDINKLLLIEFGLVYANDWFLVPFTLPAGTIANVSGMAVTNVFGERIWIKPAGAGRDEEWQRWSMYSLDVRGAADVPADPSLLLLPSVPKIQEGQPIEEVRLIRDEMANMVWGIESHVQLPSGESKLGREAALELHTHYQRIVDVANSSAQPPAEAEYRAAIQYQIMSSVPEHWIPFIPVHQTGSNREIQLQRGAMLRILENDIEDPEKIRPRTNLLRVGLDRAQAYKIFEEEVPRAGVRVYQSYQRTRWYGGRVFNWLGVRKQTGRGEGSTGLAFDAIVPTQKTT